MQWYPNLYNTIKKDFWGHENCTVTCTQDLDRAWGNCSLFNNIVFLLYIYLFGTCWACSHLRNGQFQSCPAHVYFKGNFPGSVKRPGYFHLTNMNQSNLLQKTLFLIICLEWNYEWGKCILTPTICSGYFDSFTERYVTNSLLDIFFLPSRVTCHMAVPLLALGDLLIQAGSTGSLASGLWLGWDIHRQQEIKI